MERRCPHCNGPVPPNNINCPSCFRDMPRDNIEYEIIEDRRHGNASGRRIRKRSIALFLSIIPGMFGATGLGLVYLGETENGLKLLVPGLALMLLIAMIISNMPQSFAWTVLAVGFLILFGLAFAAVFVIQFMMTLAASVRV